MYPLKLEKQKSNDLLYPEGKTENIFLIHFWTKKNQEVKPSVDHRARSLFLIKMKLVLLSAKKVVVEHVRS